MNGERGPRGERGEPGPARKFGPLYGYLAASAIMAVLLYALLFQVRSELIDSCNRVNDFRREFNAHVTLDNVRAEHDLHERPIPLTDCEAKFPRPFPF